MLIKSSSLVTLCIALSLSLMVHAGGYDGPHHTRYVHWGASDSLRMMADDQMRNECAGRGSFLAEYLGGVVCVSEVTRVP